MKKISMTKALVDISLESGVSVGGIVKKLKKLGASEVYQTAGSKDVYCIIECNNMAELNAQIDKIRKLRADTDTALLLREVRDEKLVPSMKNAILAISIANSTPTYKVANALAKFKKAEVPKIFESTGQTDIYCWINADDKAEIDELLSRIRKKLKSVEEYRIIPLLRIEK
ncbi:MAG: hypothetical protein KGH98_04725 [Candidatus Micrarchaeota archaeon]|nr:hypothetical protein [Candidatus Micrarchaeota archaeon]